MTSLKIFGLIALVMIAGTIAIPAIAQQTQNWAQTMDSDNTCDGTPDRIQDQQQKRTMDCSCDCTQTQTRQTLRDGIMKQDRDRVCQVGDCLQTQQRDQLRTRSC